jgi:hypothetical protein
MIAGSSRNARRRKTKAAIKTKRTRSETLR